MGLFRSEAMSYHSILISRDNGWEIINELGDLEALHFIDQNPDIPVMMKPFYHQIKRCDDLLLKIAGVKEKLNEFGRYPVEVDSQEDYLEEIKQFLLNRAKAPHTYINDLEVELENQVQDMNSQLEHYEEIMSSQEKLIEKISVFGKAKFLLEKMSFTQGRTSSLDSITGIICGEDLQIFKKIIFRTSKGNVFTSYIEIEDDYVHVDHIIEKTTKAERKYVFVLFFAGSTEQTLKKRLVKVCESFGARRFDTENESSYDSIISEAKSLLEESNSVLRMTETQLAQLMDKFCMPFTEDSLFSYIEMAKNFILHEKSIYEILNSFESKNPTVLIGYCWCPKDRAIEVQNKLNDVSAKLNAGATNFLEISPPHGISPPTFFKLNEFTETFQEIVDTYGVARYQEVNPGLFTVVTFPFLFGVMFGDMAHGFILFLWGCYLCFNADKLKKEKGASQILAKVRYLILMMGMFAFFSGLMYNDFASLSINLFGSCYDPVNLNDKDAVRKPDCVYPFGVDPVWRLSSNDLSNINSLKMKLAVIFGVTQMVFGIFLKGSNALYFNHKLDFYFEFIPQVLFMCGIFGFHSSFIQIHECTHFCEVVDCMGYFQYKHNETSLYHYGFD